MYFCRKYFCNPKIILQHILANISLRAYLIMVSEPQYLGSKKTRIIAISLFILPSCAATKVLVPKQMRICKDMYNWVRPCLKSTLGESENSITERIRQSCSVRSFNYSQQYSKLLQGPSLQYFISKKNSTRNYQSVQQATQQGSLNFASAKFHQIVTPLNITDGRTSGTSRCETA